MGVVELSEAQRRLYDQSARMWRDIWEHVTNNAHAFSSGVTAIVTHAQNKFYQQLILAFKVPEIQRHTKRAIRAGKCVVIGLQSTGETAVKSALRERDAADVDSLVSSAEDAVTSLLDALSKKSLHGMSMFSFAIKGMLKALSLPPAALDSLINYFGASNVAEMTGRQHRLVKRTNGKYAYVSRAERGVGVAKINLLERARFQRGEKLIAIISEAGSTGVSLHADKVHANQLRRVHIVPELGWSASKVVQQYGRTHRTNQLVPPEYVLLTCESAGERLTASAVAQKLEGLGALTKGDRSAGRGETGGVGRNLETKSGADALTALQASLRSWSNRSWPGGFDDKGDTAWRRTLEKLDDEAISLVSGASDVRKFLHRLQLLPYDTQLTVLRKFVSKIARNHVSIASQLQTTAVTVKAVKEVYKNPKNVAEKVPPHPTPPPRAPQAHHPTRHPRALRR